MLFLPYYIHKDDVKNKEDLEAELDILETELIRTGTKNRLLRSGVNKKLIDALVKDDKFSTIVSDLASISRWRQLESENILKRFPIREIDFFEYEKSSDKDSYVRFVLGRPTTKEEP